MSQTRFSILIPTLASPSRQKTLDRLLGILIPQRKPGVEVIVECDDGELSIGAKRNLLMSKAKGDYVAFIDDDDTVAENYVDEIIEATELNPDCVGFWLDRFVDGVFDAKACHSLRYTQSANKQDLYERIPNHLNPIRRIIAQRVAFPPLNCFEDSQFAERVYHLLKSEVFIDKTLYQYLYVNIDRRNEVTNAIRKPRVSPEDWFKQNTQQ